MTTTREAVEAAFNEMESSNAPEPAAAPEPVQAPEPVAAEGSGDGGGEGVVPAVPVDGNEPSASVSSRARDEHGRFAKGDDKAKADKPAPTEAPKPNEPVVSQTPVPAPAVKTPTVPEVVEYKGKQVDLTKPPQSFGPVLREHWGKLPRDVREGLARREVDVAQAVGGAVENKQFREQFEKVIAPYAPILHAEGLNPISAVNDALQFAAAMRTAPPVHKAQMLASMVRTFGVPIEALDAALAGQPIPEQAQRAQQFQPQDVAGIVQQQIQEMASRAAAERGRQELESFTASSEFMDHEPFRRFVGLVLEDAASRGVAMTLKQAYDYAIGVHPDTAPVVRQREEAKRAANSNGSTQRAAAAAATITPGKAAPSLGGGGTKDTRSEVEAAWNAHMNR